MSLAAPLGLLALLVVPLAAALLVWQRRRRRRFAVRHPGASVVAGVLAGLPRRRRLLPPVLLALAAAALAVALARPEATIAVPLERASVMLVTDESGSMVAEDVAPSRIAAAQDAAEAFLDEVPDELLVGFTSYSTQVQTQLEPTAEHEQVRTAIRGLDADGGTATGDALTAALDRLEARKAGDGSTAPSAIVLLADGATTEGADPRAAAARADRLGIPVYTVALGTPDGVIVAPNGQSIAVPPDRETLGAIAERSGGQAFATADAGELDRVYEELGSQVGTRDEKREVSAAFAAGGLLLLLGGVGAGLRRRSNLI